MNFSVVLIARNEAKTLPRLLTSLSEFQRQGGEVVLVDTGSTDATVEVATKLGCRVISAGDRFLRVISSETADRVNSTFLATSERDRVIITAGDRIFDFAAARNFAAAQAKNDMIAMPDCDELYSRLDLTKVQETITAGAEQLEYNFVFSHDQFGNEAIKFMHCKFYDRRKLQWQGIIHELLVGVANKQFLGEDVIKLEHYQNHETNRSGYLKGLALDCLENPENDRNSHYLARDLMWSNRPRSALKEFGRHVSMRRWPTERSQSLIFMGDIYAKLGEFDTAVRSWNEAYRIEGGRREPLIALARHYLDQGDYQRAVTYAAAALQIPAGNFYANDQALYTHVPHELLYRALWYLGRQTEATHHHRQALSYQPLNSKYLHDVRFFTNLPTVDIVIPQLGREEGLKRCLASIDRLNYPKELIHVEVMDGEGTVPVKVKMMVDKTVGQFICFAANDVEFTPDSLILAVLKSQRDSKGLVAFNTGEILPDEGNVNEHFILQRNLLPELDGEVFCTEFHHVGVDNLLWAQCKKLGEATSCREAIMHHYHFSKGKAEYDATYQKGWANVEADRALLKVKLAELCAQPA